jgi:hypothetical protein
VRRLLAPLALVTLFGCASTNPVSTPPSVDGNWVVLCFAKRMSVWVAVRATAESRAEGWATTTTSPVLVSYPSRGFNPAFTGEGNPWVVWMDGARVVQVAQATSGQKHLSPNQEVTAALLLPPSVEVGLTTGDTVQFVGAR